VEGSTYEIGISIYWHEDNSSIQNLTFKHFTQAGVEVNNSDNVVIQNCHFEYNLKGIDIFSTADLLVANNTFNNQLSTGITMNAPSTFNVKNSVIERNQITNTGMFPLYCRRYEGVCYGIGILMFGKAFTVRKNYLENVGWNGINLKDGGNHIVENNVVVKALSLINDGGAINIGSDNNTIRGNFLLNSIGNVDESNGCATTNKTPCSHHTSYGMGIGSDSKHKNNVIEDNTIANNPDMGIRLNTFTNSIVRNNVVYNNDPQIVVQDKKSASRNNLIEGNIMYSLKPDQIGLSLTEKTEHGSFNKNFYCNPYSQIVASRDGKQHSLASWQKAFSAYDKNSTQCKVSIPEYQATVVGANLIKNSDFTADISDWKGSISHDNGSLKMEFTKGSKRATVIPNGFKLTENQWYRLRFVVLGSGFGSIQLRFNDAKPDTAWQILQGRYFTYNQEHQQYEMFFKSPVTTEYGKLVLTTQDYDANYWLDNFTFEPVTVVLNDAQEQSKLFMNPTENPLVVDLGGITYQDLFGKTITGSVTLEPFSSQILLAIETTPVLKKPIAPKLSLNKDWKTVTAAWNEVAGAAGYILYYAPYPYTGPNTIGNINMGQLTGFSVDLVSGSAFYVG
ncbi:MAG: right-handed parallel beta-helix repeat-containing protein, partial [Candidatus Marithrix sp.]|nr:right-handed parallel beta-helix repeat-containing protein [Candidatus Marithrix sp.]